ncbi:HlyD family efflux transporter periplasmic adaptor subunit [Pseudoflavitalea sp. G-6-1-2]|uniref:HlyD family secretion protein n=1 Tax=Pseudoflavitalea sp. G-6-1-2 TaxID=2728841 RepID=UPI00146EC5F6|nr:HlyD family efflux transporter periplasmic adaptor subunit [Pseudoflavitalea sp. G-6-1-2]NML23262.1 HlyD family efflux transporter periplasmic adaptor subunit [Pseudoflavitalea sp. G-6-1-2]
MKQYIFPALIFAGFLAACNGNGTVADASGTFEVDEVIVSSELTGKILSFDVQEGDSIAKDKVVGLVDAENLNLQKEQVQASIAALSQKTADLNPQVKLLEDQLTVQQAQLKNLLHEKQRLENLIKADAATGKQLDDMVSQIEVVQRQMQVTRQQMQVQRSNVGTQNRSILSEGKPLEKRVAQLDDQLKRASITNPVGGTVIEKYAEAGEMTSTGKALYKIADLSVMTLRAYITGTQLPQVKLGQQVKVLIDNGAKSYKELAGTITWIADKAEFTPKTIQTKEERANLVYAIKVKVKNDGFLKIGMYGEIKLQ